MTAPSRGTDAERIAARVLAGFDEHYRLFREISAEAKDRFEAADWEAVQLAVRERISLEDGQVERTAAELRSEIDEVTWRDVKLRYVDLLVDHKRPELAETFFNSVSTRVLGRAYHENESMFVRATLSTEYIPATPPSYSSYYPHGDYEAIFRRILRDFRWRRPFADLDRDVERLVRTLAPHLAAPRVSIHVCVLGAAFYRNKAAYVVGKVVNGADEVPFALAIVQDADRRLVLDAVLLDGASIDILFSLSRSYFMVDMDVPSGYVEFLRTIMPTKPRSEIYSSLGLQKHGKTIFYRDLLHHLDHSEDKFVEAPGMRGQVMHVFTLPSYPYVFKVIRDRFGPTKNTTRDEVMAKFQLVKEVDRVGRMVDAFEFIDLVLPRDRFVPELLDQLAELTSASVDSSGGDVIVRHCYVERRMTPLDLHLQTASPDEVDRVVREYGDTLRQLAIANIFPGDLLWRNFGLTRHGRVVCYDYDELEYLTDCVFRTVPAPPTHEAEFSDEVWYGVGPHDVFPEEFETFLLGQDEIRAAFRRHHPDLLRPEFWQECQRRVSAGEVVDFYPYSDELRFANRFGSRAAAVETAT